MKYELDYTVYRRLAYGVYEKEGGVVLFDNVHQAQKFCERPEKMLAYFGAERGDFELRCGERPYEWDWVFHLSWDLKSLMNYMPVSYRQFCRAIFAVEE